MQHARTAPRETPPEEVPSYPKITPLAHFSATLQVSVMEEPQLGFLS